ncbi:hypothetical protein B0H13DRAFT_1897241 [Mycena leptocephala]|nr:hypothetical protein B0H13DRAFT_1897241 [Mycena leptocephala]
MWSTAYIEMIEPDLPLSVADFYFLSSRSYILVHACDDIHEPGRIEIFTFDADCLNSPTEVAILELPELIANGFITAMSIQTGPFCANAVSGSPFSKSDDSRIYMILIWYNSEQWCELFVHHRCLLKYVLNHIENKEEARICSGPAKLPYAIRRESPSPMDQVCVSALASFYLLSNLLSLGLSTVNVLCSPAQTAMLCKFLTLASFLGTLSLRPTWNRPHIPSLNCIWRPESVLSHQMSVYTF